MARPPLGIPRAAVRCLAAAALISGCDSPTTPPASAPAFARRGNDEVSVTGADPSFGEQGETNKHVRIFGSGFEDGAAVSWERNGTSDSGVRTIATRFISPTELESEITISIEATLDLYDIVVRGPGGKKGIGLELFEVRKTNLVISECGGRTELLDSRVALTWSGAIGGDGAGATYVGGQDGVHGKLFYHDTDCSMSGDLVFDPDFNANGASIKRYLTFHFPSNDVGLPTTGVQAAPFINFRRIQMLGSDLGIPGVADARDAGMEIKFAGTGYSLEFPWSTADRPDYPNIDGTQPAPRLSMNVALPGCDRLQFSHIRMTRLNGRFVPVGTLEDGTPLGRWSVAPADLGTWQVSTVESELNGVAGHWAQCLVSTKNKWQSNGSPMNVPFAVSITELR